VAERRRRPVRRRRTSRREMRVLSSFAEMWAFGFGGGVVFWGLLGRAEEGEEASLVLDGALGLERRVGGGEGIVVRVEGGVVE